jgi:hypothetical protein
MPEINFDANSVQPMGDFSILPVGEYLAIISASEIKPTKSGNGMYLQLVFDVMDGEYKGRKIFDRLNIQNQNVTAQQIAQSALSSICRAVGILTPKDSEELHNRPLKIKVGIRPASGEFVESNIIKGYLPVSKQAESAPIAVADSGNRSKKRPWE